MGPDSVIDPGLITYRGPSCCLECGVALDHARKFYSHLGEHHPEIIDAQLAVLARANDATRLVDVSDSPTGATGDVAKIPIKSK